jgi:uracil-DNA glycosylase
MTSPHTKTVRALEVVHAKLDACTACPNMIGPVVHGPPVPSKIFLLGQAPGPREGSFGRPFAWTAGKTLFRWFEEATGMDEATLREAVYFAAVARCFPGKAKGGGDRRPDATEITRCRPFLEREVGILQPTLIVPIGTLAIDEVFGKGRKLAALVGTTERVTYHGVEMDAIALPHPSGASSWPKVEPGKTLLARAMQRIASHPEIARARVAARRAENGRANGR